ncbi:MAG: hypothetical protein ACRD0K_17240 [Egibacteraceae bacterium]
MRRGGITGLVSRPLDWEWQAEAVARDQLISWGDASARLAASHLAGAVSEGPR